MLPNNFVFLELPEKESMAKSVSKQQEKMEQKRQRKKEKKLAKQQQQAENEENIPVVEEAAEELEKTKKKKKAKVSSFKERFLLFRCPQRSPFFLVEALDRRSASCCRA